MTATFVPREFSIEEANGLVQDLSVCIAELMDQKQAIENQVTDLYLRTVTEPIEDGTYVLNIAHDDDDAPEVHELKQHLSSLLERYRTGWESLEELGIVVQDADAGQLGFYGRLDERLVCLCWQYGEERIEHYHELHDGFDERKPLAAARARMLN